MIAYGSNISTESLKQRAPSAHNPTPIMLKNWKLAFRCGYATIIPEVGATTPCVVWEIDEADKVFIDYYEGYPEFYKILNTEYGFVYVMNDQYLTNYALPSSMYYSNLMRGYSEFNFDLIKLRDAYAEAVELWESYAKKGGHVNEC